MCAAGYLRTPPEIRNNTLEIKGDYLGRLIYCLLFVILADGRWVFIFVFPYVENVYYVHVHGISYSSF